MAPKTTRDDHEPVASHSVHHGRQQTTSKEGVTTEMPTVEQPVHVSSNPVEPDSGPQRTQDLVLPSTVISRGDIGKCLREVEKINEYFHQEGLRGSKNQPLPTLGRVLESLATANNLNLIHAEDRETLKHFLTRLKSKAPMVFMSFPSEAGDDFIAKLLDWFRAEVHPHVILNVGLQPELAAGCTLRTTNKYYDFSFRKRFERSKQKLLEALEVLDKTADKTIVADAHATNQPTALVNGSTTE